MSSNTPNYNDQEIDLRQVSQKMGRAYESFLSWIFRGILFVKRNLIVLIVLFILGAGIGYYLDKNSKVYDHEVIVIPNFGSAEYVYSKVELLNSKLLEQDENFLKTNGIENYKNIGLIEIEPITDVYAFVNKNQQNFELVKLMAEDGDMKTIINDKTTSMNYTMHRLKISTSKNVRKGEVILPILKFLNSSEYFTDLQKSVVSSIRLKIETNNNTINQIDTLLTRYSNERGSENRSTINVNENSQLNDILKTKQQLLDEISDNKINLINTQSIVKEVSCVENVINHKNLNGKKKFILPILFIILFLIGKGLIEFYKRQNSKIISTSIS